MKFKRLLYDLNRSYVNIFGPLPPARSNKSLSHTSSNFDDIPSWPVSSTPVSDKELEEDYFELGNFVDDSKEIESDAVNKKMESGEIQIDEDLLTNDIFCTSFSEQMIRQMIGCEIYVNQLGYGHVLEYLGQKASLQPSSEPLPALSYLRCNLKSEEGKRTLRTIFSAQKEGNKTRSAAGSSIFKVQMQDGRVIALPICPYIDTTTTTIHHEDRDNTHGHLHNYNHDKGHGDSHDGNCDVYHCQYPEGCRDDRVSDRDSDRGSDRDPSSITCTQEPRILPTKKSSNAAPDNGHAGMTHTITTSDSTNSALSSEGPSFVQPLSGRCPYTSRCDCNSGSTKARSAVRNSDRYSYAINSEVVDSRTTPAKCIKVIYKIH